MWALAERFNAPVCGAGVHQFKSDTPNFRSAGATASTSDFLSEDTSSILVQTIPLFKSALVEKSVDVIFCYFRKSGVVVMSSFQSFYFTKNKCIVTFLK